MYNSVIQTTNVASLKYSINPLPRHSLAVVQIVHKILYVNISKHLNLLVSAQQTISEHFNKTVVNLFLHQLGL